MLFDFERVGKQKEKFKADLKANDYYKQYRANYMKKGKRLISKESPYYLTYIQFVEIIETYNKIVRDKVLYESKEVVLPMRVGALSILKFKPKLKIKDNKLINKLPIDWKATKDLWKSDEDALKKKKIIRQTNEHSKGFVCKVNWNKSNCNIRNKSRYSFEPCRTMKLMLKDIMKDEDSTIDYQEANNLIRRKTNYDEQS